MGSIPIGPIILFLYSIGFFMSELNDKDLHTECIENWIEKQEKIEDNYQKEYLLLLRSGMFWEIYPELTGEWEKDKEIFIDAHYTMLPCCILPSFFYLNIDYNKEYYKEYNLYADVSHYDAGYGIQSNFQQLIEQLGGGIALNTVRHGIKNIIESNVWQTIWDRV